MGVEGTSCARIREKGIHESELSAGGMGAQAGEMPLGRLGGVRGGIGAQVGEMPLGEQGRCGLAAPQPFSAGEWWDQTCSFGGLFWLLPGEWIQWDLVRELQGQAVVIYRRAGAWVTFARPPFLVLGALGVLGCFRGSHFRSSLSSNGQWRVRGVLDAAVCRARAVPSLRPAQMAASQLSPLGSVRKGGSARLPPAFTAPGSGLFASS